MRNRYKINRTIKVLCKIVKCQLPLLFLAGLMTMLSCKENKSADMLLSNINLIDVEQGVVIKNQDVFIDGNKISYITTHGEVNAKALKIVDGTGKYVIPGLWDMHTHIRSYSYQDNLPMFLLYGVTGIRDLGLTNFNLIKQWKQQIENGEILGPRIVSAGAIIEGNSPRFRGSVMIKTRFRSSVMIKTIDEVVPTIDSLLREKVALIKVFDNLPKDVYLEILRYCKEKSIPTVGHIPAELNQITASEAGLGSIEHFRGIDKTFRLYDSLQYNDKEVDSLAAVLVKQDTYQCPTLINNIFTFTGSELKSNNITHEEEEEKLQLAPNYFKAWWKVLRANDLLNNTETDFIRASEIKKMNGEIIKKLHDRGVKMLAGTDVPNPYVMTGISLHEELEEFVRVGLSPAEALKTATLYPAQYFDQSNTFGKVKKEFIADLVILNKNPLEDISNTKDINSVIYDGKLISTDDLNVIKLNQQRMVSSNSITDFDQFIYMNVTKFGMDSLMKMYSPLKSNDSYILNKDHLLRLSETLYKGLEISEAIKALQWNVSLFPEDEHSYLALGKMFLEQADTLRAIPNLKKTIELNPNQSEADNVRLLLSHLEKD